MIDNKQEKIILKYAKSISIIVPVYNEEENVEEVYKAIKEEVEYLGLEYEIIFIDDGSLDKGYKLLEAISEKDKQAKVLRFQFNCGQTAAMQAGFDYASKDIIIPMDADMQNDPKDIKNLLDKIEEGYDVVSGWRKKRKDKALSRKLPSYIANKIISYIGKIKLHDYGCSIKAYDRKMLKDVNLYGEMHRFIPIYASWSGAKVTEIPVRHHPRLKGKSKYGIARTFKIILDLVTVKFLGNYLTKPLYFFGSIGLLSILVAFLSVIYLLYRHTQGGSFVDSPFFIFAVMCTLLGVQFILMGIIAELIIRTYHESQNKRTYVINKKHNF